MVTTLRNTLAASLLLVSGSALAIPVTWTLDNVNLNDGATATGSFIYDADTGVLSSVNIITTERTDPDAIDYLGSYDGTTFAADCVAEPWKCEQLDMSDPTRLQFNNFQGSYLSLVIAGELTNFGGTFSLSGGEIDEGGSNKTRMISSGSIVGANAVPVPAAVWLFGSALAGLGWVRRKPIS